MRKLKEVTNAGFSLASVMVSVAIIGIVSIGMISLFEGMSKSQNMADLRSQNLNFIEEVRAHLGNAENCKATLLAADLTNDAVTTLTEIKNADGTAKWTTNTAYHRVFTIAGLTFTYTPGNSSPPAPALTGSGYLTLQQTSVKKVLGTSFLAPQVIEIRTRKDSAGVLQECVALAKMSGELWQRSLNIGDIYYSGGYVGIGTDNPQELIHANIPNAGQGFIRFSDTGDAGGSISFGDGTSTALKMAPTLLGRPVGDDKATSLISQIDAGEDNGITPAINLIARVGASAQLTNRPLVSIYNHTTQMAVVSANGNVGIGTTAPEATLEVKGAIVSQEEVLNSGSTVDFSKSLSYVLRSVGGSTIQLQNMVAGGIYTLVIEDLTSRTYTFSGCGTVYFSPPNGATTDRSVYTVYRRGNSACYITWTSNFN